ncbi:MAG: hypothetical protein K8R53_01490 [Bacteroidales bacterium]|nr:hypothetical protein [Bacteroidales bacterium]
MKYFFLRNIIFIIGLLIIVSCCERDANDDSVGIDCSECYQDKPDLGPLNARLTINEDNPWVAIIIYRGYFEDKNIEYNDISFSQDYWVDVPVDRYYSIVAKYIKGTDTIFVVDGDKLKVKHTDDTCDEPCYYFSGGYFDLRLKN